MRSRSNCERSKVPSHSLIRSWRHRLPRRPSISRRLESRLGDLQTALEQAGQRRVELDARLAQEIANRDALGRSLVETQKTLETAERRHATELQTAAQQRTEYQSRHEVQLAQRAAAHDALAQQLREVEGALAQSHQEAERLTRRETELAASLAEAAINKQTLESRLGDLQSALEQAGQRRLELDARLAQEIANRDALGRSLVETQKTLETAERRHATELQMAAQQHTEFQSRHEAQLAERAAAHDALAQQLREAEGALAESHREAERLAQRETELAASLAEAAVNQQRVESRLKDVQTALEQAGQRRVELGARLAQEIAYRDRLAQKVREAQDALTRAEQDAAAAATAAAAHLTQRESAYTAQLAQQGAERKTLESKLADTRSEAEQTRQRLLDEVRQLQSERDTIQQSLSTRQQEVQRLNHANDEARENLERARKAGEERASERAARLDREITQLQDGLRARGRELETTKSDLETVRIEANRVPQLQSQLDGSRAELLRTFVQAPYAVCRCARDGTLKDVNEALATLLGYRTPDALRKVDFAKVFESPDDLRLLIESCLTGGESQPVETTWATRARDRIIVRLIARPVGAESIEIVAEEVTNLRVVEAQLRQAQRMEAVGRLAVEVAGTCDNLLRDVSHDALQWLATVDPNSAFRRRGELLLQEVDRAANFLRQLSVYSTKQATPLEPSDVNRVLRQMEPVLKRIAGDNIELVLPKSSSPVKVDVEAEHVERVLVNAASYGRERMRSGGRMMFEFATVEVGREFAAQHPNVRSGGHVLMTIKEVRGAAPSPASTEPSAELTEAKTPQPAPDIRPGVDLGVLQGLISDCGGHLWMKAEPTGEMVMKVRLPQHDRSSRSLLGPRRGGSFDWLRH